MKNRKERIKKIIEIIRYKRISNQDELQKVLSEVGFNVTQATLSRDLRLIKTSKISDGRGEYFYKIDERELNNTTTFDDDSDQPYVGNLVSIQFSGNLAVIKTRRGYANAIAHDIDKSGLPEIIGTIAGNDTLLAVIRQGITHRQANDALLDLLKPNNF